MLVLAFLLFVFTLTICRRIAVYLPLDMDEDLDSSFSFPISWLSSISMGGDGVTVRGFLSLLAIKFCMLDFLGTGVVASFDCMFSSTSPSSDRSFEFF